MVGGVRKGAWTEEEDSLLRKCIEKYGEGKWHQVPLRAGLRRCRKSCRLRWLNYLRPNIKRGNFSPDEVDLIIRLHKLLGNRWSLIAGRLPGRTANDVKNYWNTHQTKKSKSKEESDFSICKSIKASIIPENNIVKPRPRTFTRPNIIASLHHRDENATPITTNTNQDELIKKITDTATDEALSSSQALENSAMELFKGLFQNEGEETGGSWRSGEFEDEMNRFWLDEIPTGVYEGNNTGDNDKEKTLIWDNDVYESAIDMDIWGLLGFSQDHELM